MSESEKRDECSDYRTGKCKWFNVAKGWGFITPNDGGQEVFVHQSVIQMSGFRSLGENEEVEFLCTKTSKGLEATDVRSPDGGECKGSEQKPRSKQRLKKIRCYNCGEFANHLAAKCSESPMPKRCHHCKSGDHLIGDCPTLGEQQHDENPKEKKNEKKKAKKSKQKLEEVVEKLNLN